MVAYGVFAFDPPTQAPPGGNVEAPLHGGLEQQEKLGNLLIGSLGVVDNLTTGGDLIVDGSIKVGELPLLSTCGGTGLDDAAIGEFGYNTTINKISVCTNTGWEVFSTGVDFDEDGFIVGTDCDDRDEDIWQFKQCFIDNDGDGVRSTYTSTVCSGLSCVGDTGSPGTDCDGGKGAIWQLKQCFVDNDGDGYGASSSTQCSGSSCPAGFDSTSGDCDDSNGDVNPGQTRFFTTHRGDGSFDYNCDDSSERRLATCTTALPAQGCTTRGVFGNAGWVGSAPGCGVTGTWRGCVSYGLSFDCSQGRNGRGSDFCTSCPLDNTMRTTDSSIQMSCR